MQRVLIATVSGGVLQGFNANFTPDFEVRVIDIDNIKAGDKPRAYVECVFVEADETPEEIADEIIESYM